MVTVTVNEELGGKPISFESKREAESFLERQGYRKTNNIWHCGINHAIVREL